MAFLVYLKTTRADPAPQIWDDSLPRGTDVKVFAAPGIRDSDILAKYKLKDGEEKLSIAELVKRYPPPKPEPPPDPAPTPKPAPRPFPPAAAEEELEETG